MSETLDTLHRAVIADPLDRTVRLIFADALDETGEPAHRARAEFIRAQVEVASGAFDVQRLGELTTRCDELFDEHWLEWWTPVATAAGLPPPHVPRKRLRDRIAQRGRRRFRQANWPYTISVPDPTIHLADYGLSFRFVGGFPEDVRFQNFNVPEDGPELIHRWGDAIPLVRLGLSPVLSVTEWESVNGPHLARLTELTLDSLLEGVAPAVAESRALERLTRLTVNPVGSNREVIRAMVASPAWENLKALRFSGRLSPDAISDLASTCTLHHVEELELAIGDPGLFGSAAAEAASAILRTMLRAMAIPALEGPRSAEFGPAFLALAAARWVGQLRVLRIVSGNISGFFSLFAERLHGQGRDPEDAIPDAAILALAAALAPDKLERLVLPATVVSQAVREELTARLGGKVVFM